MKTWLITNYDGSSRIVGVIVNNLARKTKPVVGKRREKLNFYSAITRELARKEELQLIYSKSTALGVIGGGSIMTEYGSF